MSSLRGTRVSVFQGFERAVAAALAMTVAVAVAAAMGCVPAEPADSAATPPGGVDARADSRNSAPMAHNESMHNPHASADGNRDEGAVPNLDTDGDGVLDAVDTDGDQVPDARDACPHQPGRLPLAPGDTGCPRADGAGALLVTRVPFRWNSAVLLPDSVAALKAFTTSYLKHGPIKPPTIVAHASPDEPAADELAAKRAQAVVGWLKVHGFETKAWRVQLVGATKPASTETTNAGRTQNRRVEVQFNLDR